MVVAWILSTAQPPDRWEKGFYSGYSVLRPRMNAWLYQRRGIIGYYQHRTINNWISESMVLWSIALNLDAVSTLSAAPLQDGWEKGFCSGYSVLGPRLNVRLYGHSERYHLTCDLNWKHLPSFFFMGIPDFSGSQRIIFVSKNFNRRRRALIVSYEVSAQANVQHEMNVLIKSNTRMTA